jgi:hypothetical protein
LIIECEAAVLQSFQHGENRALFVALAPSSVHGMMTSSVIVVRTMTPSMMLLMESDGQHLGCTRDPHVKASVPYRRVNGGKVSLSSVDLRGST